MIPMAVLKTAFDSAHAIAKKVNNKELNDKIIELQGLVFELYSECANEREARERATRRLKELEEAARDSGDMRKGVNSYWTKDESGRIDGPFCTRCWELSRQKVSLSVNVILTNSTCPECGNLIGGFEQPEWKD